MKKKIQYPQDILIKNIQSGEDLYFLTCSYTIGTYFKYVRSPLNTKSEILKIVENLLTNDKFLGYELDIKFEEMNIRSEKFLDEMCDKKYLEISQKKLDRLTKLVEMKETKRTALIGGREQDNHELLMNTFSEEHNTKNFIDWDTFFQNREKGIHNNISNREVV